MIRICHVTNSLTRTGGGTANVIWGLADAQARSGNRISLLGLKDPYDGIDYPDQRQNDVKVHTFRRSGPYSLGWSSALHAFLNKGNFARNIDLLHQHGIWSLLSHSTSSMWRRYKLPTIIATHGMLNKTALQQSRWKKILFGAIVERGNLRGACCLHALCHREVKSIRTYGLGNPIAIIPNGIDLKQYAGLPGKDAFVERFPAVKGRPILLFMGRLDPLKGVLILIEAWKKHKGARRDGWILVIAGSGYSKFERLLRERVTDAELDDDIVFTGPLYGGQKLEALSVSNIFILPSFSEGFPMAVLEAMACRLPVVITDRCNIDDVATHQAGWVGKPTVSSISEILEYCLSLSARQRQIIGEHGFRMVARKYTWESAAMQACEVYEWILGKKERPANVLMDYS